MSYAEIYEKLVIRFQDNTVYYRNVSAVYNSWHILFHVFWQLKDNL